MGTAAKAVATRRQSTGQIRTYSIRRRTGFRHQNLLNPVRLECFGCAPTHSRADDDLTPGQRIDNAPVIVSSSRMGPGLASTLDMRVPPGVWPELLALNPSVFDVKDEKRRASTEVSRNGHAVIGWYCYLHCCSSLSSTLAVPHRRVIARFRQNDKRRPSVSAFFSAWRCKGRLRLQQPLVALGHPSPDPIGFSRFNVRTKSHTQLTSQSQTLRGGHCFRHCLVQHGADDAAMNDPFEPFPIGRWRPLSSEAAIGTGSESDPQTVRMVRAAHDASGLGPDMKQSHGSMDL